MRLKQTEQLIGNAI